MKNILRLYKMFLHKHPVLTQAVQTSILMGTGDIISQTIIEKKTFENVQWKRAVQFMSVGFFVGGPGLRAWYGILNKYIGSKGRTVVIKKVACDQLIFAPVFIGLILITIGFMQGQKWNENLNHLQRDYPDVLINNYKVWPLVQLINFYLLPLNYQVLFAQIVAVFWNTYLSWKTNVRLNKEI